MGLGLEVVELCQSRPGGVGLDLKVVGPCRSRPGGVGLDRPPKRRYLMETNQI